jgi:hypothetical protein
MSKSTSTNKQTNNDVYHTTQKTYV